MTTTASPPGHSQQASNIYRCCAAGPGGEQRALTQMLGSLLNVGHSLNCPSPRPPAGPGGMEVAAVEISRQPRLSASHLLPPESDVTVPFPRVITKPTRPDSQTTHREGEGTDDNEQCRLQSVDISAGSDRIAKRRLSSRLAQSLHLASSSSSHLCPFISPQMTS